MGSQFLPELSVFGRKGLHKGSLLFPRATAVFRTPDINGDVSRRPMQPRREFALALDGRWRLGETRKNCLGDVFGERLIQKPPFGDGVNQIRVPTKQVCE